MSLLAGLRERRSRGELSIELSGSRTRVQVLEEMALGMLECVQALVLDIEELGAAELQQQLAALLGRVRAGDQVSTLAEEVSRTRHDTLDFAEHERRHLAKRDAELRHIIEVLTAGLATVASGAAAYHRTVLDNGSRFEAASRLSDLVRMRAAITQEVSALRAAVAQRQAQEATATAALRSELDRLRAKVEDERRAARLDPLTRAANRAAFDEELARLCTAEAPFALLLADIDHFKQINDRHGHPVGDRVLHALVTFLRDRVRRDDMIARWGGEEFAVILPGASLRAGFGKARELVAQLARVEWSIDEANVGKLQFTMSVGATARRDGDTPAAIVERVDRALYAAKHGGRNRAVKD